jgi:hypothetical protein
MKNGNTGIFRIGRKHKTDICRCIRDIEPDQLMIVYYSFCKLLSRRKKIKRLQYSKERDYNPEGL